MSVIARSRCHRPTSLWKGCGLPFDWQGLLGRSLVSPICE
nr:MAG TPA: hypothetical protein [Crassvirales sp.]